MSRIPILLEFVGLPGCGKTTVAERVIAELLSEGYRCGERSSLRAHWRSRRDEAARFRSFNLANPGLYFSLYAYALRVGYPNRLRRHYLEHLRYISYFYSEREPLAEDIVVLDQSFVQTMWSLSIPGRPPSAARLGTTLDRLLRPFCGSFAMVRFGISTADAATRITTRRAGFSRFDGKDSDEVVAMLNRYGPVLEALAHSASRHAISPVLDLDAMRPVEENATAVVEYARRLVAQRAEPSAARRPDPVLD